MSEDTKFRWTIASARQHLPKLVDMAAREPQAIYRRNELVARVVSPDSPAPEKPSMAEALAELQRICSEESYTLEIPERRDRPNAFAPPPRGRTGRSKKRKR